MQQLRLLLRFLLQLLQKAYIAEVDSPVFSEIEEMDSNWYQHRQEGKQNVGVNKLHNCAEVRLFSSPCKIKQIPLVIGIPL